MIKQKIIRFDEKILKIEKKIVIISVLLMLFLSFLQVILRIFFHWGIIWLDIFLRYLVMVSAFISASIVSYYSGHFKIEIFEKIKMSKRLLMWISRINSLITLISVIIIIIASFGFISIEFDMDDIIKLNIKPEYMSALLPLIFINMLIHTITSFFREEKI